MVHNEPLRPYRNNGPFALEEMTENGALFIFNVVGGGYRNVGVTQHLSRSGKSITRIDLAAVFLA